MYLSAQCLLEKPPTRWSHVRPIAPLAYSSNHFHPSFSFTFQIFIKPLSNLTFSPPIGFSAYFMPLGHPQTTNSDPLIFSLYVLHFTWSRKIVHSLRTRSVACSIIILFQVLLTIVILSSSMAFSSDEEPLVLLFHFSGDLFACGFFSFFWFSTYIYCQFYLILLLKINV